MKMHEFEVIIRLILYGFFIMLCLIINSSLIVASTYFHSYPLDYKIDDWLKSKHNHNDNNLEPNIFIPFCSNICMLSFKYRKVFKSRLGEEFNQIHPNNQWQNNHIYKETHKYRKCCQTIFFCNFVESNVGNEWFCHCIEETVIYDDEYRSSYIIHL